jgi:hypothetical protein
VTGIQRRVGVMKECLIIKERYDSLASNQSRGVGEECESALYIDIILLGK